MIGAQLNEQFFFLYLFPKSKKANVTTTEKQALKKLARTYVNSNKKKLEEMLSDGSLIEIETGENSNE